MHALTRDNAKKLFSVGIKNILFLLIMLYPLAVFIGYSDIANAIFVNLFQTGVLILALSLIHISLKELVNRFVTFLIGKPIGDAQHTLSAYWLMVLIDVFIVFSFIVVMLLIWGVYPESVYNMLDVIFVSGVKVGDSAFSVLFVAKAIAVYFVVYYFFKLVMLLIEKQAFPYTKLDNGTKDAIRTAIGYLGLILATIMAVYSLGLNSTSLAFILSAFTFGISFGLKEIFNNFISGVILLIERPIKIGDWINVGGESGEVKQIRLRSTMVETFDKKTLLIPNAQFITTTVSNDLYNPISRASIEVGFSYDDNPVEVQKILLDIANTQEKVLSSPEPYVVFSAFGDSSLNFQLRFYCKTAEQLSIITAIRFRIVQAFRDKKIEMPYAKQDLYIKEMPK